MNNISSFEFQGMRTDLGDKLLDVKYFRDVVNFNQNDIIGANKTLAPVAVNATEFEQGKAIDGIFGYSYLDSDNKLQKIRIIITGGAIYAQNGSKTEKIYEGLETGLCDFAILNDKLFITNGKNGNILLCDLNKKANITGVFELANNNAHHMLIYTVQCELYVFNYPHRRLTCLKNDFTRCENVAI